MFSSLFCLLLEQIYNVSMLMRATSSKIYLRRDSVGALVEAREVIVC